MFVLALSTIVGSVATARAQEIQLTGPLAGAPAIPGRRFSSPWMRFELGPTVTFPVAADLHGTPLAGARLGYWGSSRWQVGVWGTHAVEPPPRARGGDARIGQLTWLTSPEFGVVPLAGNFRCLDIEALLAISAGPAVARLEERRDCAGDCERMSLTSHSDRIALGGTGGVGLTLQPVQVIALTFDWRLLVLERSRGIDLAGSGADGESPDGRIDERDRVIAVDQLLTMRLSVMIPDAWDP